MTCSWNIWNRPKKFSSFAELKDFAWRKAEDAKGEWFGTSPLVAYKKIGDSFQLESISFWENSVIGQVQPPDGSKLYQLW